MEDQENKLIRMDLRIPIAQKNMLDKRWKEDGFTTRSQCVKHLFLKYINKDITLTGEFSKPTETTDIAPILDKLAIIQRKLDQIENNQKLQPIEDKQKAIDILYTDLLETTPIEDLEQCTTEEEISTLLAEVNGIFAMYGDEITDKVQQSKREKGLI